MNDLASTFDIAKGMLKCCLLLKKRLIIGRILHIVFNAEAITKAEY